MSTDVADTTQIFLCSRETRTVACCRKNTLLFLPINLHCIPSRLAKGNELLILEWHLVYCSCGALYQMISYLLGYSLVCTSLRQPVDLPPGCWMDRLVVLNSALGVGKWSDEAISQHKCILFEGSRISCRHIPDNGNTGFLILLQLWRRDWFWCLSLSLCPHTS